MTTIKNLRDGVFNAATGVKIDRSTKWGNPFHIGRDGSREEVIAKYRSWLWEEIKAGRVSKADLAQLHGRALWCWCAPQPCHGDVLKRAAKWAYDLLNPQPQAKLCRGCGSWDPDENNVWHVSYCTGGN